MGKGPGARSPPLRGSGCLGSPVKRGLSRQTPAKLVATLGREPVFVGGLSEVGLHELGVGLVKPGADLGGELVGVAGLQHVGEVQLWVLLGLLVIQAADVPAL
jgi:hypothetical protein